MQDLSRTVDNEWSEARGLVVFSWVQMKMQDLLRTDPVAKSKKQDAATPDDIKVEEEEGSQGKAGPSTPVKDADEGISSPLVVGNGPASAGRSPDDVLISAGCHAKVCQAFLPLRKG